MSYLRYLYLFVYSDVQHNCVVFFAPLCCQFLGIVHF